MIRHESARLRDGTPPPQGWPRPPLDSTHRRRPNTSAALPPSPPHACPQIGALQQLAVLNIADNAVEELPAGLAELKEKKIRELRLLPNPISDKKARRGSGWERGRATHGRGVDSSLLLSSVEWTCATLSYDVHPPTALHTCDPPLHQLLESHGCLPHARDHTSRRPRRC